MGVGMETVSHKSIENMTDSEVRDWKASLQAQGREPKPMKFPTPLSGSVYDYDSNLGAVVESTREGARYIVTVADGELKRAGLLSVAYPANVYQSESNEWFATELARRSRPIAWFLLEAAAIFLVLGVHWALLRLLDFAVPSVISKQSLKFIDLTIYVAFVLCYVYLAFDMLATWLPMLFRRGGRPSGNRPLRVPVIARTFIDLLLGSGTFGVHKQRAYTP